MERVKLNASNSGLECPQRIMDKRSLYLAVCTIFLSSSLFALYSAKQLPSTMGSRLYQLTTGVVLIGLHLLNHQLCAHFIRPTLLPLLFTTTEVRLVHSIENGLKTVNTPATFPAQKIKIQNLNINQKHNHLGYASNSMGYSTSGLFNHAFDLLVSLSLQLIGLFLLEIIKVTDFQVRHLDWYFTLSILVISLLYFLPSYFLFCWIFPTTVVDSGEPNRSKDGNIRHTIIFQGSKLAVSALIWCITVYTIYRTTVSSSLDCNFMQTSLYMISLFGVSCISLLNGIGCLMGCNDSWDHYRGHDEAKVQLKELELTYELQSLDTHLNDDGLPEEVWNKLIVIDSLVRDINFHKQSKHGLYHFIKISTWGYCFYKVLYGTFRVLQMVYYAISVLHDVIDHDHEDDVISTGAFYDGSGDFLSVTIAKIVLVMCSTTQSPPYASYEELFEAHAEKLDMISMIVNFIISVIFFIFSFQNVLLTIKNFKQMSRTATSLLDSNVSKFNLNLNLNLDLNLRASAMQDFNRTFYKLTSLFICEMTGIYVVSTALLLNSKNMPLHLSQLFIDEGEWKSIKSYYNQIQGALIDVDFMNNWFDKWFAVGALATLGALFAIKYVRMGEQGNYRGVSAV